MLWATKGSFPYNIFLQEHIFGRLIIISVLLKLFVLMSHHRSESGVEMKKICPKDFMGAVRFLRVRRSPLKWLEVWVVLFLFHFIGSLLASFRLGFYEVKQEEDNPDF